MTGVRDDELDFYLWSGELFAQIIMTLAVDQNELEMWCSSGFSFACEDFGGGSMNHSSPALLFSFILFYLVLFDFFFQVQISSRTPILFCKPGSAHSSSAGLDDSRRAFVDELRVSSFP